MNNYKSIRPDKIYSTIPAKCGLYLTNNGLYPEHECNLVNELLITSDRIERNYLTFKDLSTFISWVKSNLIETVRDTDLTGSNGLYIGYWIYKHITKYGTLEYHKGEFMSNLIYFKQGNLITCLGEPELWLNN